MKYEVALYNLGDPSKIPEAVKDLALLEDEPMSDDFMRNILVISQDGIPIRYFFDGGEPEDNTFTRDWSWVAEELRLAYAAGQA